MGNPWIQIDAPRGRATLPGVAALARESGETTVPAVVGRDGEYEFTALEAAANYRSAVAHEFAPWLRGEVVELGAGVGQMTEAIMALARHGAYLAVEPDHRFSARLRERVPSARVHEGLLADLVGSVNAHTVVGVNVLEHIPDDRAELAVCAKLLRRRRGVLCLLVPAGPELFSPIDGDFGHCRRYTKRELFGKLRDADFEVIRLEYFNMLGYLAWLVNFTWCRSRRFEPAKVRLFDGVLFPLAQRVERLLPEVPFGQSLVAVARCGGGTR